MPVEAVGIRNRRAAPARPRAAPARLLVFDPVAGAFSHAGERTSATVVVAETVEEATQLAMTGGFDVLVVDLETAGPGGLGAVSELRDGAPGIPLVVLVDEHGQDWASEALRHGAVDCLVKSGRSADGLVRCVREAVARAGRR